MKNLKYIAFSVLALGMLACENELVQDLRDRNSTNEEPLPELTAGSADFSNYVAVGASFTAGFTDNALFIASQENSFPNIMANAFSNVGGGVFTQPFMNDNFGGLAIGGNRITEPRLVFGGAGPVPLESVIGPVTVSTDIAVNNPTGPFSNLGIPGAKSFHLVAPGYGNIANFPAAANPYAVRVTGDTPNASIIELAVAQNPTFFTLSEVGGNDVLGYATTGGDGSNPITDINTFDASLNAMVGALTSTGAKGAIGNLPNITSLSFFTTVAYNPVPLDQANANALNQGYADYNGGVQLALAANFITQEEADARTINFTASSSNAVVIEDEYLTDLSALGLPNYRQTNPEDLVLLTAGSLIPQGGGTATPLSDTFVLTIEEQTEISDATDAYNASLSAVASANGLALVDLNSILVEASTTGIQFDDYFLNTDLVFGGLVSLDGVHLTARGYAFMANSFLKAIDATYGSNFEASGNLAKAGNYPTNYSPLLQ
ncbi:MAG: G-D-S-L family lipolytic protein [Winogradskyella sp.]|uniref:G-D-S-L family lipolytic protein n=1 Tax=Winogradskyella sp. TaxID=1883156 RepID=UPI0017BE1C9C|nr:G-D-S-L family lipolytic protein [Winogradskyella sp.]